MDPSQWNIHSEENAINTWLLPHISIISRWILVSTWKVNILEDKIWKFFMALKEKKSLKHNTKSNNHKENNYCIDYQRMIPQWHQNMSMKQCFHSSGSAASGTIYSPKTIKHTGNGNYIGKDNFQIKKQCNAASYQCNPSQHI